MGDFLFDLRMRVIRFLVRRMSTKMLVAAQSQILALWADGVRREFLVPLNPMDANGGQLLAMCLMLDGVELQERAEIIQHAANHHTAHCHVGCAMRKDPENHERTKVN